MTPAAAGSLRVVTREASVQGTGAARRIVLVHGSMDRASSFGRLTSKLTDFTVTSYDRRGYAGSSELGAPERFEDQVADLLEVLDGKPAVVFGHSFGGTVVLATAQAQPSLVKAALVWEPPQPWLDWWPKSSPSLDLDNIAPEDQAEWFMRRVVGERIWERLPESTRRQRRAEGPALAAEIGSLRYGAVFDAEKVEPPVLVGRGGDSRPHHRRTSRELASSLPRGQLVEVAGAAHGVHLTHPSELADLIRRAAELAG